jgi:glutathione S-transferase
LWLFEELNLPYKLEIFHRNPKTRLAPPELKKIHPLGKSPVITIAPPGSATPVTIAESGLIIDYLIQHFGQNTTLKPKQWQDGKEGKVAGETEEYLRYQYFLQYSEGSFMPLMIVRLITMSRFFFMNAYHC